jgi:hypothetical protein
MQEIKLTIKPSVIIESVKADSFLKGRVDLAANQGTANAFAFQEQAGDDAYQMRKLEKEILTAAEQLNSYFARFITAYGYLPDAYDESLCTCIDTDVEDELHFHLQVTSRFNRALVTTLARLTSEFVEKKVLAAWYTPFNPSQASVYAGEANMTLENIRRLFNRTAPVLPPYPYPKWVKWVTNSTEMTVGETKDFIYSYGDAGADNDFFIKTKVDPDPIGTASLDRDRRKVTLTANRAGEVTLFLFSRHDDKVTCSLDVTINDE